MAILSSAGIAKRLTKLPGWKVTAGGLRRKFVRKNFADALAFVNRIGALAQRADHHPDILLHAYKRVTCTLMTHSEHGITAKDFALAAAISRTAG